MIKVFIIVLLAYSFGICSNLLQLDSKGGFILSEKAGGSSGLGNVSGFIDHRLWIRKELGEKGYFRVNERFEGSSPKAALPERTLPMNHYLSLTLGGHHKADWLIGVSNDLFINANEFIVPWYPLGASFKPKSLSLAQAKLGVYTKSIEASLWGQYNRLSIDYTDEFGDVKPAIDDDVWGRAKFAVVPLDLVDIKINTLLKHDLNSNGNYSYSDIRFGAGESLDLKLGRKRFYLGWQVMERILISQSLYDQGKSNGYSTELMLAPMLRVKNNLYLIMSGKIAYGEDYKKQRYRIALRKSWRKLSRLIISCQGDFGCAIPRLIGDVSATAKIKKVEITPKANVYSRINNNDKLEYYRTDAQVEVAVEVFKKTDITISCLYTSFLDNSPYTNRLGFFLGVKR